MLQAPGWGSELIQIMWFPGWWPCQCSHTDGHGSRGREKPQTTQVPLGLGKASVLVSSLSTQHKSGPPCEEGTSVEETGLSDWPTGKWQYICLPGVPWSLGNGPAPPYFALNPWDPITFQDHKRIMCVQFVSSMGA